MLVPQNLSDSLSSLLNLKSNGLGSETAPDYPCDFGDVPCDFGDVPVLPKLRSPL